MKRGLVPVAWLVAALIAAVVVGVGAYVATHNTSTTVSTSQAAASGNTSSSGAAGSELGSNGSITEPMIAQIDAMPKQPLSPEEVNALMEMREEEKLARDVYLTLYQKWGLPIFHNIAQSEQTHTDTVKALIDKYGLQDPVQDDNVGVFSDPKFTNLYEQLVAEGSKSVVDALKVGATIEDLDIKDLQHWLAVTDNNDIRFAFCNLMKGSRNHLRSFVSQLQRYGASYTPQYISEQEYNAILSSSREAGIVECP